MREELQFLAKYKSLNTRKIFIDLSICVENMFSLVDNISLTLASGPLHKTYKKEVPFGGQS